MRADPLVVTYIHDAAVPDCDGTRPGTICIDCIYFAAAKYEICGLLLIAGNRAGQQNKHER
jgi:hypothetical protein